MCLYLQAVTNLETYILLNKLKNFIPRCEFFYKIRFAQIPDFLCLNIHTMIIRYKILSELKKK